MQSPPFDHARFDLNGGPLDGARYRLAELLAVMDDDGTAWLRHQGLPEPYVEQADGSWRHAPIAR